MTKEYEAYKAHRKGRNPGVIRNDPVYPDYLMHHGIPGQRKGHRRWQREDGSYTEEGKHRYGWGFGRKNTGSGATGAMKRTGLTARPSGNGITGATRKPPGYAKVDGYQVQRLRTGTRTADGQPKQRQVSQAEIEARKARTRKIFGIAAGVAVAAALSYAAYRGSTKLRDNMRSDVYKNFDTDPRNLHTLTSKYWDSADRKKYSEMSAQRAKDVSDNITRRDAVAARFAQKTGIQISIPQSRKRVMAQRKSENRYANFIWDAEKRGAMNKSIHDARQELRDAQKRLTTYSNTKHIGTSKQYEEFWTGRYNESVAAARERLNNLLQQRRAG